MAKMALGTSREVVQPDCIQALVVEFICTFLFVFAGVGSAMAAAKLDASPLVGLFFVGITHAFVVAVMVAAALRISGGHLNPAVTLGLALGGHITIFRSILYWIDQLAASAAACILLHYLTGGLVGFFYHSTHYFDVMRRDSWETPPHVLASGIDPLRGVLMEVVLTFSLVFTAYMTLVDPKKGSIDGHGPTLTGLVVGANILAGGAFSAASMNPARSFGPALVSGVWTDHWVYWVGPLVGGAIAGFVCETFFIVRTHVPIPRDEEAY